MLNKFTVFRLPDCSLWPGYNKGMYTLFLKMRSIVPVILFYSAICIAPACVLPAANAGTSTRIEVYPVSQHFLDVQPGDTLGDIVKQLLPDNPAMRKSLLEEIVQLNPDAFNNSNPDNLKANVRLWLPNNAPIRHHIPDKSRYETLHFSWGEVHKIRR